MNQNHTIKYTHEISISASRAVDYPIFKNSLVEDLLIDDPKYIDARDGRLIFKTTEKTKEQIGEILKDLPKPFYEINPL